MKLLTRWYNRRCDGFQRTGRGSILNPNFPPTRVTASNTPHNFRLALTPTNIHQTGPITSRRKGINVSIIPHVRLDNVIA